MANEMETIEKVVDALKGRFAQSVPDVERHGRHLCVAVAAERVVDILTWLRRESDPPFDCLTDLLGVDYCNAGKPERFAVIYQLYSFAANVRMAVKAYVPEAKPEIATVTSLWKAADWAEREVFDMYGIVFRGHPNMKRLLMPDEYVGHPLRKDYPLKGRGERDRFPVMK